MIYLFLQEHPCLKFVNYRRKILELEKPEDDWFKIVLRYFGIAELCAAVHTTINHCMYAEFTER